VNPKARPSRASSSTIEPASLSAADALAGPYVLDTLSGARLDLDDPKPDNIHLADLAGALSKVCRFGAQASRFYSVAQHALLVARFVEHDLDRPDLAPWALHHDSAEAYTCDLPRPLKLKLREDGDPSAYDRVSDALDAAIAQRFGLQVPVKGSPEKGVIDRADDMAILVEADALLHNGTSGIRPKTHFSKAERQSLAELDPPLAPDEAEHAFRAEHTRIVGV
jgi:hypothetical protein